MSVIVSREGKRYRKTVLKMFSKSRIEKCHVRLFLGGFLHRSVKAVVDEAKINVVREEHISAG